jgi:hypothetical protein
MVDVLPAVAWILGEYSDLIIPNARGTHRYNEASKGTHHSLVQALTAPTNISQLPTTTQSVYVQAAMKVFAAATAAKKVSNDELEACVESLNRYLPVYMESTDVEVQERAFTANELLRCLKLSSLTFGEVPGLAQADSDDEQDDNLLGMMQTTKGKSFGVSSSLAARCRGASETLNYILKPEPMKPTGAKAQRKKRQAPIGVDVADLDAPVDLSVFSSFTEEEQPDSNISMDSVSFTQQRPLKTESHSRLPAAATMDMGAVQGDMPTAASSFQHMGLPETGEGSGLAFQPQNPQHHDPFYLDSGAKLEESNHPNRFGTIQLGDSDGNDSEEGGRRRKKKKHKKRPKEKAIGSATIGDADFSMLTMMDAPKPAMANVSVYTSDDDDDDHPVQGRKKAPGKEFEGLARVDLTTPLREDEIIPERQHHVVPERRAAEPAPVRKKKKEKKQKKARAQTASSEPSTGGGVVGDLLDLGGFMPIDEVSSAVAAAPKEPAVTFHASNPISTAFDDLLGLSAPSDPMPAALSSSGGMDILGLNAAPPQASKAPKGKRAWMKASIRASHAEGSPVVDWSKVALHYRVHSKQGGSASVTCRVENHMDTVALNNVTLQLKGHDDVAMGNVDPGQSVESPRAGLFTYGTSESSVDMKGSLVTPECKVAIKMTLPATHFLNPRPGLSQEDVMSELSSSQWSSHSVKLLSTATPAKTKSLLCSFLRAAEVEGSTSPAVGTLAAQSLAGSKVFVLIKIKDDLTAKVDLKCSDETLGKALAADIKKLIV